MQRVPLAAIGANRRPKHQLSSKNKHQIVGRSLAGQSHGLIARAERLPKSTVTSTLCKVTKRRNTNILPRSGRPREYSETDAIPSFVTLETTHYLRIESLFANPASPSPPPPARGY